MPLELRSLTPAHTFDIDQNQSDRQRTKIIGRACLKSQNGGTGEPWEIATRMTANSFKEPGVPEERNYVVSDRAGALWSSHPDAGLMVAGQPLQDRLSREMNGVPNDW
jgi:hypothetical protein